MSSSLNSYFFTNATSLEIYLRREFIHALLITHTIMLDQCCVHVNKAEHFCVSTEMYRLYMLVWQGGLTCAPVCVCVGVCKRESERERVCACVCHWH